MSDFKSKIKDHYNQVELSDDQFEKLNKIMTNKPKPSPMSGWLKYLVATCFAFVVTVLVLDPFKGIDEKIMNEVVRNHLKNMPSEVLSSDLVFVEGKLTKLDFSLIPTGFVKGLKLVGARYCSIQGKIAAQLSYRDEKGRRFTVYQVPIQKEFKNKVGHFKNAAIKGVDVNLYVDSGLLIAKAVSK